MEPSIGVPCRMNTKRVGSISETTRSRLASASVDSRLVEVAKLLSSSEISLVVVCASDGTLAGIITKSNIVEQIGHCQGTGCMTQASQVMVRDVTHCGPDDSLADVLSSMAAHGFVHVPVLDGQSRPIGVVNARDALRALLAEEQYEESLLRDYVMGVGYR
jgi:CBS domain-containing protein